MYKISNLLIKEIVLKTDIVNLISSRILLKKKGNLFFALCPFHNEKNPSFLINNKKKFYYCFGCKSYGNCINFLMNFNKLTFVDSIKELSNINNINLIYINEFKYLNKFNYLHSLLKDVAYIYNNNLINNLNKKINNINNIINFFLDRKWNLNIIKEFNIGYSSNNIIYYNFVKEKKKIILLEKLGILLKLNGNYVDRFNNRIIFPIYDINNNIISFGGRSLYNKYSKYINTPENEIFKRRNILYNINKINKKNNFIEKLLIVEGYSDVISLYNNGIYFSISSFGTSLTNEHIKLIFKYTNNILFCYDGDIAGKKAYLIILKKILNLITDEKQVKFIFLPNNEDPDSLINKIGKNNFLKLINRSKNFYEFLFDILLLNIDILNIRDRINFIKKSLFYINKIPGIITKKLIKKELFLILKIKIKINNEKKIKKSIIVNRKYNSFQIITSLLIQNPTLCKIFYIPCEIFYLKKNNNIKLLINIINICKTNNIKNSNNIIKYFLYKNIYSYIYFLYKIDNFVYYKNINKNFLDILNRIYINLFKKEQDFLIYKEKIYGLNIYEKNKFWLLNVKLFNKKINED